MNLRSAQYKVLSSLAILVIGLTAAKVADAARVVRPESVREYVERTREWRPGEYLVRRLPDRYQLEKYQVELISEQPASVPDKSTFVIFFDKVDRRVVGERMVRPAPVR